MSSRRSRVRIVRRRGLLALLAATGMFATGATAATAASAAHADGATPTSRDALVVGDHEQGDGHGKGRGRALIAARYELRPITPATDPTGEAVSGATTAVGLDDAGNVVGRIAQPDFRSTPNPAPFVGDGRTPARWLDVSDLPYGAAASAISPTGQVVGKPYGVEPVFVSWSRQGARTDVPAPWSVYGPYPAAINSAAVIAGSLLSEKGDSPFIAVGGHVQSPAQYKSGRYAVAGITQDGIAAATVTHPMHYSQERYPEGLIFTAETVTSVVADTTSTADAISRNGRYLVGRVGVENDRSAGTAAWLSTIRPPAPLPNADGLFAHDVSDRGLIVGARAGKAVAWARGELVDLTARTCLPRGWALTSAAAVNPRGQIAADATGPDGITVVVRLDPTARRSVNSPVREGLP